MKLLTVALLIVSLAVSGAARARSQPRSSTGTVWLSMKGWGDVKLGQGIAWHGSATCRWAHCPAASYLRTGRRVVLVEKAFKGWKFTGWHGACKSKQPKCVIDVARLRRSAQRNIQVGAKFIPVAPGWTRAHPLPIGTTANIGGGVVMTVNSANANVQLSPAAPAGDEYFDANITVMNTGTSSIDPYGEIGFGAMGGHRTGYQESSCPAPEPQPPLEQSGPIQPGESRTGYVCWQVATNDASTLELFTADGTLNYSGEGPYSTWFALH